jgi:3-(3-hydroxy-phenyl)propionate hydroxylase
MLSTETTDVDVIVVGAGPSGLATALLLAGRNVSVAVIDPNRIVCQHPRATHLDDETMRTLQTLGAQDMEPQFLQQTGWTLHAPDGREFLELSMPAYETEQGWFTDYMFHQPDFESRLRGLLADKPDAHLWLGWSAEQLEQDDDDGVTLTVRDRSTGAKEVLTAKYLVGADGAGSFVRRAIHADVEDLQGTQRSLIVDIHPFKHPESLPKRTGFVLCERELPVVYVPIFPPKLRFEFMLSASDDAHDLERPESVYRLLGRWLEPGSYRIMRSDTYEWHAHLVRGWRSGRVLLAGDAAHEMPPMLGQGMCSGLRDAMNLAWKLAFVVTGLSPATILDSYESERSPHVRPLIMESARQSNIIESIGRGAEPPVSDGPQVIERHHVPLGPGLLDEASRSASVLAPQPRGTDGDRLDDATGYSFVVLGHPDVIASVSDVVRSTWSELGAVVLTSSGEAVESWLAKHGAKAAIIRPDRYVFAMSGDTAELEHASLQLLNVVRGTGIPA